MRSSWPHSKIKVCFVAVSYLGTELHFPPSLRSSPPPSVPLSLLHLIAAKDDNEKKTKELKALSKRIHVKLKGEQIIIQ